MYILSYNAYIMICIHHAYACLHTLDTLVLGIPWHPLGTVYTHNPVPLRVFCVQLLQGGPKGGPKPMHLTCGLDMSCYA